MTLEQANSNLHTLAKLSCFRWVFLKSSTRLDTLDVCIFWEDFCLASVYKASFQGKVAPWEDFSPKITKSLPTKVN